MALLTKTASHMHPERPAVQKRHYLGRNQAVEASVILAAIAAMILFLIMRHKLVRAAVAGFAVAAILSVIR